MTQTPLAEAILKRAAAIQAEHGSAELCASHVAAAVAEFCTDTYTGLDFAPYCYPRFEQERLRYLFSGEVKPSGYFRLRLRQNQKAGVQEGCFDLAACEEIAAQREAAMLSADVLFLSALIQLHESYRKPVKSAHSREAVLALLEDADVNIYDYVIEKIQGVCKLLQAKAQEAAAIRDWKPKEAFATPEQLTAQFYEKIQKSRAGDVLTLRLPRFFGTTDLKMSIFRVGDIYYIHDNGCALRHLAKQVSDPKKRERVQRKVCHAGAISKGRITGSFIKAWQFVYYLQGLCFIAHGDLFYTRLERQLYREDVKFLQPSRAEPLDEEALLAELKTAITFGYDENRGLYYWLDTRYSLSSTRCAFLMETLADGRLRISDMRKGQTEGEIFEQFYWDHQDLSLSRKFIDRVAARFGGVFNGEEVFVTDTQDRFYRAMVRFFNMAVVLSELGHEVRV